MGVDYVRASSAIRGLLVQRRHTVVVALLCATLGLSGCGNALNLEAGRPAAQGLATATPGQPVPAPGGTTIANVGPTTEVVTAPPVFVSPGNSPEASAAPVASAAPESSPPASEPQPTPTVNPEFSSVQFPSATDRWRYVQVNRTPFETVQTYTTPSKQLLWWYDPVFGQPVKLGEIQGDFPVQAAFRFRGQEVEGLEIPYQVNQSFGITLPSAVVERIKRAGAGDWIEAFVYKTDDIRPR